MVYFNCYLYSDPLIVSVHQVGFNFNLYKMNGEYNIKYRFQVSVFSISIQFCQLWYLVLCTHGFH